MGEKLKGLYQKYTVERNDGREISHGCFVLELKDPKARKALLVYAAEVEKEGVDDALAYDLRSWVGKYEPVAATKKDEFKTFNMAVLLDKSKELDVSTLYIIPSENSEEYKGEQDLVLPAVVTVDMKPFLEYHAEQEARKKELDSLEDPLLNMAVNMVIKEYQDSDYADFSRFWDESMGKYQEMFQEKYKLVEEKANVDPRTNS